MVIQEKKAAAAKRRGKTEAHDAPGLKSGEAGRADAEDGVFESCDHDIACSIRIGWWAVCVNSCGRLFVFQFVCIFWNLCRICYEFIM
jgi:hypothetical protein